MLNKLIQSRLILIVASLTLFFLTISVFNKDRIHQKWQDMRDKQAPPAPPPPEHPNEKPPHPPWVLKPQPDDQEDTPGIVDNFPSAAHGLPPIPHWNVHPPHGATPTPLLIGFTRNWRVLQQAVVSYVTSGWPASDIYVIENTGVMDNNKKGRLDLQNPFFLNYTRLEQLGVNVIRTPTLLNFAQLQNFYINFAVERDLKAYYWGHMDVISLTDETKDKSVYVRAVDAYHDWFGKTDEKWAAIWFAYDRLVLVNTAAYLDLGGWDTFIGYYLGDCDFHERIMMKGYRFPDGDVGFIYDVGRSLDDLRVLYREGGEKNDQGYKDLIATCDQIQRDKNEDKRGRNFWQGRQEGGQGDPFYRDARGFQEAIQNAIEQGRTTFGLKWGHRDCNLRESNLSLDLAWKVEKDWVP